MPTGLMEVGKEWKTKLSEQITLLAATADW